MIKAIDISLASNQYERKNPKTCSRKGCDEAAVAKPVLLLYPKMPKNYKGEPARAQYPLSVCETHRKEIEENGPEGLLVDDAAWITLERMFRKVGRGVPDRRKVRVEFESLETARLEIEKSVVEWWTEFASYAVPNEASRSVYLNLRRVFFAGVLNAVTAMYEAGHSDIPDEEAVAHLVRLMDELQAFFATGGPAYEN